MYHITKTKLLFDLYYAYQCAIKHKSSKDYVVNFEKNLHRNLCELCDEIYNKRYKPKPSVCFIINEPKKREIFAANFRDRIVHHLYYNYTYEMFDRTFIEDSYSCRIGKGTHYGINRLEKHIREESESYSKSVYILKMDIKGYFIHINRVKLLKIIECTLNKMKDRISPYKGLKYFEFLDVTLLSYLTKELVLLNPTENCIIKTKDTEWMGLDKSKSLFVSEKDCGLPIGNLTSQLFSNVYLNVLDQYVKRVLKCKHYGRYVDDFYIVSKDKKALKDIAEKIKIFIRKELDLEIQDKKTIIVDYKIGIDFLGGFLKRNRKYLSNSTIKKIKRNLYNVRKNNNSLQIESIINSYLGLFSHYKSNKIKKKLFESNTQLAKYGYFTGYYEKFVPHKK